MAQTRVAAKHVITRRGRDKRYEEKRLRFSPRWEINYHGKEAHAPSIRTAL